MENLVNSKPLFFLRVSSLCHVEICSKRAKIETFNRKLARVPSFKGDAISFGNKAHRNYGRYSTDFDRDVVRGNLERFKVGRAFERTIEMDECTVVIRGDYDDLRVLYYKAKAYVSFIELKTTSKKYMWSLEVKAAIRQLQIYLWLLEDLVKSIGYDLWKRHYVEEFSQVTGDLIQRVPVEADPNIEEWIKNAIRQFIGLAPMTIGPYQYCKICPFAIKAKCEYFSMRKGEA